MSEADQHARRLFTPEKWNTYNQCVGVLQGQYKPRLLEERKCRLILKMFYDDKLPITRLNESLKGLHLLPAPLLIITNMGWFETFGRFYKTFEKEGRIILSDAKRKIIYDFLRDKQEASDIRIGLESLRWFGSRIVEMRTEDLMSHFNQAFDLKKTIRKKQQEQRNIDNRTYALKSFGNDVQAMNEVEKKDKRQIAVLDREIRKLEIRLREL